MKKLSVLLLLGVVTSLCLGQSSGVKTAPKKGWVEDVLFDKKAMPASGHEKSYYYLVLDDQENYGTQEQYAHYAYKVLTNEGVQDMADLSFSFDPLYEQLTFHTLVIHRGDSVINKLPKTFRTIQREESMDRYIYDGALTTVVNLSDVRVGDVIEYAYTRKGYNPVHKDHIDRRFYLDYQTALLVQRFIVPMHIKLTTHMLNDAPNPVISQQGNNVVYTWRLENVASVGTDGNSPVWYDPSPRAAFTSFADWHAVNQWAAKLFMVKEADKKALQQEITRQFESIDPTAYTQEVTRFVQDEVRYLGFESGLNTHMPYPPLKVFRQRFGDCKDKSLLLTTLLNARGIAAFPVLVNTTLQHKVSELLPSAYAFDHCVVQITLNGKTFYIDPTINNQGGRPGNIHFPDYGKGLVIDGVSTDFVSFGELVAFSTVETQTFTLDSIGGGALFSVSTTYIGADADDVRGQWSRNSASYLQKNYMKFYANQYPDIEVADTVQFNDNRDDNTVVVNEFYRVPKFWSLQEGNDAMQYCTVRARSLETYFNVSKSAKRDSPFALSYPINYTHVVEMRLPYAWSLKAFNEKIDNDYYAYTFSAIPRDKAVMISTHYRTKQSSIPAEDYGKYIDDHTIMWNNLSYQLTNNLEVVAASNNYWPGITIGLLVLGGSIFFALRVYRHYNPTPYYPSAWAPPLGGWLILVGIGITLSPLIHLYSIIQRPDVIDGRVWLAEMTAGMYGVAAVHFFLQMYNLVYLVFSILLLVLFYKRRSSFPHIFSIVYSAVVVTNVINVAFIAYLDQSTTNATSLMLRVMLAALIWIPYFNMSQRVKRTFVFVHGDGDDKEEVVSQEAVVPVVLQEHTNLPTSPE